jgi:hypothetical protein
MSENSIPENRDDLTLNGRYTKDISSQLASRGHKQLV